MSKAKLVITAVVIEGRTQAEVARAYGVSKGWVSKLIARYREEGEAAMEPRSRRPRTSPNATRADVVDLICDLRRHLLASGLDVVPRDVVNALCWGESADAGVGAVVIVVMDPGGVGGCASSV